MIYSRGQKAFYWYAGCVRKVRKSSRQSMDKIREKYGSVILTPDKDNSPVPTM